MIESSLETPPTTEVPAEPYLLASAPATRSSLEQIAEALHSVVQLQGLSDVEYCWLAEHGTERRGERGALVFREGEPSCHLNFILEGEIHVRRRHSGPAALFIGRAGQMTGKLPFSRMKGYGGDGYTIGSIWVLDIHQDLFPEMLAAIPSMAQRCVSVLLDRVREVTRMEQQAEKLSALGKLAGNLAHELNNPASAAQRSADRLFNDLREYREQSFQLGALSANALETPQLRSWFERMRQRITAYAPHRNVSVSALDLSEREDQVARWLGEHGVENAWAIAPAIAESAIGFDQLDELVTLSPPHVLPLLLTSLSNSLRIEGMAETIVNSTGRIFDLISAIKDYSYMDQAPVQEVDLAQSLSTTLVMFQSRLGSVAVETDFDSTLPLISAYGSELSQVWTALIENALDAMRDEGTLRLVTRLTGQLATIEVIDSGIGIDPATQSRIFEPFYTTKPPGSGLGLGLDTAMRIVTRHSGLLTVESEPGHTCFKVRLPLDQAEAY